MPTYTICEFGALDAQASATHDVPVLPEIAVTAVDSTSATTHVLNAATAYFSIQCADGETGRVSMKAAIGAGNLGVPVHGVGQERYYRARGAGSARTLYLGT